MPALQVALSAGCMQSPAFHSSTVSEANGVAALLHLCGILVTPVFLAQTLQHSVLSSFSYWHASGCAKKTLSAQCSTSPAAGTHLITEQGSLHLVVQQRKLHAVNLRQTACVRRSCMSVSHILCVSTHSGKGQVQLLSEP